ncbi:E3 ubiquitin-protein ligase TRIM21-like [Anoplopoma fimbria]|uniref:E3 ubiquitin-protein ligase TRIM21-like n=1 Tax=Anoplopoma fimbria TaxID=229290 RepID=UPI0023EC0D55|nr:E3 ubiquitin-protein ligase TRIM21-like [Anoplopoma fimbria]
MAKLNEELWKTLQDLKEDEFEHFKWFLKQNDILEGFSGIPVAQLEKAKRQDTVDLMVQKYQGPGALERTMKVLEKISRNDLVQRLQSFSIDVAQTEEIQGKNPDLKWVKQFADVTLDPDTAHPNLISPVCPGGQKEDHERKKAELMRIQQFAVEVTLDPDTAHPNLILSGDGKQVHHGDVRKTLPDNPERFCRCVNILGKKGFTSGKSYFEVQVKQKTAWALGVANESIKRRENITAKPKNGYWTIMLTGRDEYSANSDDPVSLSLNSPPQKVGVFVDYQEGLVSFYDVDAAHLLYSFTGCSFTEKLYPFFTPFTNDRGINSAPLIISPVNRPLNFKKNAFGYQTQYERKKAELMRIQQFAVEVTLDPETAHPNLILSGDGKQVHHGDVRKTLPDNPERFFRCVNILGKQGFTSGKSYFEVQVKQKTSWTVGVANESISRGTNIKLSPEDGYWTMWLRNEDEYVANDDRPVHLSLSHHPEKVGVFVDYDKGLVSFYDVDAADLLYSFTGCSFTEKIYPFFSPSTNNGGINSAPLILCPVNQSD